MVHSTVVMGNGKVEGIKDFVHLKVDSFDQSAMQDMARS